MVNCEFSQGGQQFFLNHEFEAVELENFVVVLWLIQSQTQRGPASAA